MNATQESQSSDTEQVPPWAAGANKRMEELYPDLNDEEFEVLREYGEEQAFEKGSVLWVSGARAPLMAILEGGIDVVRREEDDEQVIVSLGAGQFVGEINSMSGARSLLAGRASESLKAIVVHPNDVRRLIATESDLGEKILQSFILRRMRLVAERLANVTLLSRAGSKSGEELQSFLSRNGLPFNNVDPASRQDQATRLLAAHGLSEADLPVIVSDEIALAKPSNREVAELFGLSAEIDCGVTYDVAVVGSGPAGLAAAVYAASEGLSVLVLESCAPGGQAGSSSRIENYMGFPTGISGQALMGRAYLQAQKFGAQVAIARELLAFEPGDPWHKLRIDGDDIVFARAVVIATGAVYRQPAIDGLDECGGVHYGASFIEGELCRGQDVAIVGGGNSAGQAAVYLSKRARRVHILIRGAKLSSSMSDYLIQRIEHIPNIDLHSHSEVDGIIGDSSIEGLVVRNNKTDSTTDFDVSHLFIFIGAKPGTDFVDDKLALDDKGFVLTGDALDSDTRQTLGWNVERRPYLLEASCPRVFAVGDVRSGSVKRVASAVGEGSVSVQFIHNVLAAQKEPV